VLSELWRVLGFAVCVATSLLLFILAAIGLSELGAGPSAPKGCAHGVTRVIPHVGVEGQESLIICRGNRVIRSGP
jgi:hypothetical protein